MVRSGLLVFSTLKFWQLNYLLLLFFPEEKKLTVAEKRLQKWKDSVVNCPTLSRLHVLLSMMDSCIKWEKSAENAVS